MKKLLLLFVLLLSLSIASNAQSSCTSLQVGAHSITLTWSQTGTITGDKVYCSLVAGGPYVLLKDITSPAVSYTQSSLPQNTKICYVVTAYNTGGESGYSNEVCGTTLPDKPPAPTLNPPIVTELYEYKDFGVDVYPGF